MEKITDTNENVIESLRKIFIEKNLIKNIEELDEKGEDDDDEEEEEKEERDLYERKEDPKENSKVKKNNIDEDYVYLIKGDALIEEKNEKRGKKKTSSEKNILDELEI